MAQNTRAGTGDSVADFAVIIARTIFLPVWNWIKHIKSKYSTLINYDSILSMCGIFLIRSLPPPDNHELFPTPKETQDLKLSKVLSSIRSFQTPRAFFCTKPSYNLGVATTVKIWQTQLCDMFIYTHTCISVYTYWYTSTYNLSHHT